MFCSTCFSSTRVFGVCVLCAPKPGGHVTDPDARWVLDVLAEQHEETLSDEHCKLIQRAVTLPAAITGSNVWWAHEISRDCDTARQDWDRKMVREAETDPETTAAGKYVGEPGERWTGRVRCESIKSLGEGQWGETFLIKFIALDPPDDGADLVWITGAGKFDPQEGQEYKLACTVKRDGGHAPWNGVRQTKIQRPKEITEKTDGEVV